MGTSTTTGPSRGQGPRSTGLSSPARSTRMPANAEGLRQGHEVGVVEARAGDAAELAPLVHLDQAVAAVASRPGRQRADRGAWRVSSSPTFMRKPPSPTMATTLRGPRRERGGDGGRQAEAHGREAVGDQHGVGLAGLPEARHPELVGADVADTRMSSGAMSSRRSRSTRCGLTGAVVVAADVERRREGRGGRAAPRGLPAACRPAGWPSCDEDVAEVADELDLGHVVGVDLGRHGVDADDAPVARPGSRPTAATRPCRSRRRPRGRRARGGPRVVLGAQAGGEEEVLVAASMTPLPMNVVITCRPVCAAELAQRRRGALAHHAVADQQHRAPRLRG